MKMIFFILSLVLFATQSFAATEEVLFSCRGGKTRDGVLPIYKVESLRDGHWASTVEAEGVLADELVQPDLITITSQAKSENGCALKFEQKIDGKARSFRLVYADKELTLKEKTASNFDNAPCKVISKNLRKQLNDCKIEDSEVVEQGLLCRSASIDDTEIHIRLDANKDATYAVRTIYSVYKGKAEKLSTKTAEIITNSIKDGNECVVEITEANQNKDNRLKMVIRLKKPFSDTVLGRVDESKMILKNAEGQRETKTLPDEYKNMKCEFMGDFFKKATECNIDTTVANEEASPKTTKKPSSPSTESPTKKQNTKQ